MSLSWSAMSFAHSLGLIRITFPGYTYDQLIKIIESRLEGLAKDSIEADAIQFASRKVAAVSGDARRALDICRRAVELAEESSKFREAPTGSTSAVEIGQLRKVSISTIKDAIKEATSSPLQQLVKNLPLNARALLLALLHRTMRNGGAPSHLAEVLAETQHQRQLLLESTHKSSHLTTSSHNGRNGKARTHDAPISETMVLQLAVTRLVEAGIVEIDTKRQDRVGRVRLAVGIDDINIALRNDDELRSRGIAV